MYTIDKIMELLKSQGKTQRGLAEHLGVKPSVVSNWASGISQSYKKYLPQIAEFFEVTVDALVSGDSRDDDIVKFALFGTTDIDDEVYNDVKHYAKIAREMRKKGE